MPVCEPCSTVDHQATDCVNNTKPICDRACPCRHGLEPDPAPYWSRPASANESQADPLVQARELPAGWVTPGVEESAQAMAAAAEEDWKAIGHRRRVAYRLKAYGNRRPSALRAG